MDLGPLTKLLLLWLLGQLKSLASMQAVRLVNGQNIYEGRVEICLHGIWKTVCDDFWSTNNAKVVCAQLGYRYNGARALGIAAFGRGRGSIVEGVFCYGNETSLTACQLHDEGDGICIHAEDAGVQCSYCHSDGDIRLQGAIHPYGGLVEVCVNGSWITVCSENWDSVDAGIVCRQLGYSKYGARGQAYWPQWTWFRVKLRTYQILSFVRCSGNEKRLIDCSHSVSISSEFNNCFRGEASVTCQQSLQCQEGEINLVNGSKSSEGRVEICLNETWGTVCGNNWDEHDSIVVCKQLGYSDKGAKVKQIFELGDGSIHLNNVLCIGNESNLCDCQYDIYIPTVNCIEVAGVSCSFDIPPIPLNLQATVDESNNFILSWQAPNVTKRQGMLFYYLMNCTIWRDDLEDDYNITAYTNDTDQILELLPYASYTCCVSSINEVGVGNPACQSFIVRESAPTTPPANIKVHPFNATSVFLSWRPPLSKHHSRIIWEYDIEIVELNTTTKVMYTTQDPFLLINNLDPDKIYLCRIAAITTAKGPYSEFLTINLFSENDYCQSDSNLDRPSSIDACTCTDVMLATSIASGVLLLLLFLSSIVFAVVCLHSRVCKSSKVNTRHEVQSPVYEMIDITATDFGNSEPATVISQQPTTTSAKFSNDLNSEADYGHQEGHFTPVHTNITQPTNKESTYQPLIPLRAHQKSISTEYQSLKQLSKEKFPDLPPPLPPKLKC